MTKISRTTKGRRIPSVCLTIALTLLPFTQLAAGQDAKISTDDLIARHLASMGTAAAREAAISRVAQGTVNVKIDLGASGNLIGPLALASIGDKRLIQMQFEDTNYPREEFYFDGQKPFVPRVRPEGYTEIGRFVNTYNQLLRDGLLGGTLSTGWAMLDVKSRKPKLTYQGTRKVDGVELHRLQYRADKGPGDVVITLYFEPETFRHVLSTYTLTTRTGQRSKGGLGGNVQNPQSSGIEALEAFRKIEFTESFSDFKIVDGVNLPTTWKIKFILEENAGSVMGTQSRVWEWNVKLQSIDHKMQISPEVFSAKN